MALNTLLAAFLLSSVTGLTQKSSSPTTANKAADKVATKVNVSSTAPVAIGGTKVLPQDKKGSTKAATSSADNRAQTWEQQAHFHHSDAPNDEWAPEDPTAGNSLSGAFVAVVSLLLFGLIPLLITAVVLVTAQARHALLSAGLISADGEITKLSLKASSMAEPLTAALASFPLVQQAFAAIGIYQGGKHEDLGANVHLINDSDGEDEEDAPIYDVKSSRPMSNVAERKQCDDDLIDINPEPSHQEKSHTEDLIDFASAPQPEIQVHVDHHSSNFINESHDDFFDDEEDF